MDIEDANNIRVLFDESPKIRIKYFVHFHFNLPSFLTIHIS